MGIDIRFLRRRGLNRVEQGGAAEVGKTPALLVLSNVSVPCSIMAQHFPMKRLTESSRHPEDSHQKRQGDHQANDKMWVGRFDHGYLKIPRFEQDG